MRQNDLKGFGIPVESDTRRAPFDLLGTGEDGIHMVQPPSSHPLEDTRDKKARSSAPEVNR